MSSGYHRRSREGCATCKAARIKCDENRPKCQTCRHRKVECAGYVQQLKWIQVDQSNETGRKGHRRQRSSPTSPGSSNSVSPCSVAWPLSIARNPKVGAAFQSQADMYILEYWDGYMPRLSLVNPGAHPRIQECQRALLWDPESILLPAIIAHGASHLASRKLLSDVEALQRKQVALEAMARTLPKLLDGQRDLSLTFVSTSMTLSAIELSRGGDAQAIIPHICATSSQILRMLQTNGQPSVEEGQDELLKMRITQMCYFDTMCCVPCARRPVVPRSFWDTSVLPYLERRSAQSQPDLFLGLGPRIFPLIGEAAALVEALFEDHVSGEWFVATRDRILVALENETKSLPALIEYASPMADTENSVQVQNYNGCVLAARAHAIATQIFLMRAGHGKVEVTTEHVEIFEKVTQLRDLVYSVLPCLNAATMMLWPLFVLGCETSADSSRCTFAEYADAMLSERWFLNIESAFDALKGRVWKLDAAEQRNWAWHCWRDRIELCLA